MTPPADGSHFPSGQGNDPPLVVVEPSPASLAVPAYLRAVYTWAYLNPRNVRLLDRPSVVSAILFGNGRRLSRAALAEFEPGQRVFQAAHVYGGFIPELARTIGPTGRLDVVDAAPIQVRRCRQKLNGHPQARVRLADAGQPADGNANGRYDIACSFFLLHEVPDEEKRAVVDALLKRTRPGGKTVFVDYHRPARWHPVRPILAEVFRRLEPFAESLWHHEIADFADAADTYRWEKRTYFGGVYQKVVARRA